MSRPSLEALDAIARRHRREIDELVERVRELEKLLPRVERLEGAVVEFLQDVGQVASDELEPAPPADPPRVSLFEMHHRAFVAYLQDPERKR